MIIDSPYKLPCGYVIKNRIAKASTTEHLAEIDGLPNQLHHNLYSQWARSGAAFVLQGNLMIDRNALEGYGNVILDENQSLEPFRKLVREVKINGGEIWMQINHAGNLSVNEGAISPSGIQHTGKVRNFPKPREATESDIENIISRFVYAATVAKNIGYSGVEIHAAHQFLICQFLSPLTNRRNDKWGGCLENRMRFLMEVVRSVRSSVGYHFPLAVKLNLSDGSNDFNGWTEEESVYVCAALEKEKVDFIELSSGSYEFAPMLGSAIVKVENRNDEAYFINYAKKVRKFAPNIPIMLTGGVRDVFAMENILKNDHAQILGLARPFIVDPNVANRIISGEIKKIPVSEEESLPVMDQLKSYQEKIRLLAEKKS